MSKHPLSGILGQCRAALAVDASDGQLLERFVATREEAAFGVLLDRHGPMVWSVCRRWAGHHDAEDAFQATFLVLARRASSIRRRESLGSWLYGVAYRSAIRARQKSSRRPEQATNAEPGADPARTAADQEVRQILDEEIDRLPEKYRAPVVLHYLEGRSKHETARQLGWSEGTVSGRLARARELLRRRLDCRGLAMHEESLSPDTPAAPRAVCQATAWAVLGRLGGPSPSALALCEEVVRHMFLTRLKIATVSMLVLSVTVLGGSWGMYRLLAAQAPANPAAPPPAAQAPAGQRFDSATPLDVFLITEEGIRRPLGNTPTKDRRGIVIPEGTLWCVSPSRPNAVALTGVQAIQQYRDALLRETVEATRKHSVPALYVANGYNFDEGNRLAGQQRTLGDAVKLDNLPNLRCLILQRVNVSDQDMQAIGNLPTLERVMLNGNGAGSGLRHLARATALKTLRVSDPNLTDEHLAQLKGLEQLETLWLSGNFSDAGLAHLKGLENLQSLSLVRCPNITNKGLEHLKGMKGLTSLALETVPITDEGVAALKETPNLKRLTLRDVALTDTGMEHLKYLRGLRTLHLQLIRGYGASGIGVVGGPPLKLEVQAVGNVTDAGLVHLQTLPELTELTLMSEGVTDKGMATLGELTQLRELWLSSTKVTEKGLAQLKGLRELEKLQLRGCAITDVGFGYLGEMHKLQEVTLWSIKPFTGKGAAYLRALPNLKTVTLDFLDLSGQRQQVPPAIYAHYRRTLPQVEVIGDKSGVIGTTGGAGGGR
ncbi:MAG: sigma-70 family RNA polymerase sigma factor [Gemmataceae bacterium]